MSLKDDLEKEVQTIFQSPWTERDGTVVPSDDSIKLKNDAVKLNATVLYADLTGSTILVDEKTPQFAAEVYKTYLHCAGKIIRSEGGAITAYDGDRIMAVFIDDDKESAAAKTALKIRWAVKNIINPSLKSQYPKSTYEVKQVIGIDTSPLYVAKTGVRGANDLVWVGRSANYAAKLCSLHEYPTYITKAVYDALTPDVKFTDGKPMWESRVWKAMNNMPIYRSNWNWAIR